MSCANFATFFVPVEPGDLGQELPIEQGISILEYDDVVGIILPFSINWYAWIGCYVDFVFRKSLLRKCCCIDHIT
jgi:hypothetical protein